MATTSSIALQDNDKVYQIYCHFDGYPEHNGEILKQFYDTKRKVKNLIKKGDMFSLDKKLSKCDTYDKKEKEPHPAIETTIFDFYTNYHDYEIRNYNYIFVDNHWFIKKENKLYLI